MQITTEKFGKVDVNEDSIFTFVKPIIGFENNKQYILIEHNEKSPFKWLQSIENGDLAFPISYTSYFNIEYVFEINDEDENLLELENIDDLLVLNIVNIPLNRPQDATINLLSPVLFNFKNKKALQTILTNTDFPTRYALFKKPDESLEKKN